MLRNYLAAALRNLAHHKLYGAINITGLAVGFAAAILIGLFVRDELSYDRWIAGHERTYLVSEIIEMGGARPILTPSSPAELAGWLREDFPQIEAVARLHGATANLRRREIEHSETLWWADPDFFLVLPVPAIAGNLKSALQEPNAVVLTRKMARKYFGRDDPIGKALEINRQHPMTVTAVIENLPSNTHLKIGIVASGRASFSPLTQADALPPPLASGSNSASGFTYLRLKPGASMEELRKAMPAFIARHAQLSPIFKVSFPITAIAELHLSPPLGAGVRAGIRATLYAAVVIAVLVLLVSSINFINLMTARASRRAIEVGIRKAAGAGRRELIVQFIGECLIHTTIAAAIAIALVELVMPAFNSFLDRQIEFDYWRDPLFIAGALGFTAAVGVLAGAYPAFVLARLHPVSVFGSGDLGVEGSRLVRQGLVILQLAVLVGLLLATIIIQQQSRFALNKSLRLANDPILIVVTSCAERFKQAIAALPGVRGAACSRSLPSEPTGRQIGAFAPGRTPVPLWHSSVSAEFFELYGLKPVAGRFFEAGRASDVMAALPEGPRQQAIVLNETAVKALGFPSSHAAVNRVVSCLPFSQIENPGFQPCEIIGVVPDYAEASIREPIPPSLYYLAPDDFLYLSVRLDAEHIPRTVSSIDRLWMARGEPRAIHRFFLDQALERLYLDIVRQSQTIAIFAGIALFIASLGLFGLSAFLAERRTREIGIRKALGADRFAVLRKLAWDFTKPVLWANLIAWSITVYFMTQWLQDFAHRIELELWMFATVAIVALVIALSTVSAHALALARVRPRNVSSTLRHLCSLV